MGQIKYSYCLDENNELVHIKNVTEENRHSHIYHCLQCGQEMTPKLSKNKKGSHESHFAHAVDTACDGESYLHKLAKRRIREKFMSSDTFPLTFVRDVPCQDASQCPYCQVGYCLTNSVSILSDLKIYKESVVYDTCQEEITIGEFRPDLLLTGPMEPKLGKVFIEVYKTHQSKESKLTSDYKIIETKKIKTEADIDDIINRGFVEGDNCKTFNFSPKMPLIKKSDVPITRFVLFGNGAAKVFRAADYDLTCDSLNQRVLPQSIRELNIKGLGIDIWGNEEIDNSLDSYQTGLVYLVKKGLEIKNCILCKYYKYNEWQDTHVCIRYKSLGEKYHFPKQSFANDCPKYDVNPVLLNHSLSELEKMVSEVPI